MKLKFDQIIVGRGWAAAIFYGILIYGLLIIYVNWDPGESQNYQIAITVALLDFVGAYFVYQFLAGKTMHVFLLNFKFDDCDFNKVGRWISFTLGAVLVIFLPGIASSFWN